VTSPGPESGLLVEIAQAEPAVGLFRERLDSSARLGVPAHITVLYPFIPPAELDSAVLGQLERLFASIPRFAFRFDETGWFNHEVVWLAPSDPAPFRILTQRVVEAFPAYPPYGGDFEGITPHLTIGDSPPADSLREAEESIRPLLPIIGEVTAVSLITQEIPDGQFRQAAAFPLA
jgi:2'-5' RNA ligase superfamily protein